MAPFSLQKLFWLCLTPAPSGSYPSNVLLSTTNINIYSYYTLATNHKEDILLLTYWAQVILSILAVWVGWFDVFFFALQWMVLYFVGYAAFWSPILSVIFPHLSPLPCAPWSCSILLCRRKTLTWPCWPAFLWLCLIPLYAGGYPFVHLQPFPVWFSDPYILAEVYLHLSYSFYHIISSGRAVKAMLLNYELAERDILHVRRIINHSSSNESHFVVVDGLTALNILRRHCFSLCTIMDIFL